MRKKALVGVGIAVTALVTYLLFHFFTVKQNGPDDEAPIRVKNGSLDIQVDGGVWSQNGNQFVFYNPGRKHRGHLWVRVQTASGVCKLPQWDTVTVQYQPDPVGTPPVDVVFQVTNIAGDDHSEVDGSQLTRDTDQHLHAGTPNQGRITKVWSRPDRSCTVEGPRDQVEVLICSHPNPTTSWGRPGCTQ